MDDKQKMRHERIWQELQSYEGQIFGYIKNAVGNADIAQDLFQDVYLQALQNIGQLDPARSLKNWLITVTRNRVINFFQEKNRRQYSELTESALQTEISSGDYKNAFQAALQKLPERQQKIFVLREIDGLSYSELGREFGLSESAVTSLLKRARQQFSRAYLLQFLPDWFKESTKNLELQDIFRFINSFEPAENLLDQIDKNSQKYFSEIKGDWDTIRKDYLSVRQLDEIFTVLGAQENKRTLDLGSGNGFIAWHVCLKGALVDAVEINPRMVEHLKQMRDNFKLEAMSLVRANLNRLPFRGEQYDQVFCTLVLHHLPQPQLIISDAAAVLKKGGFLIIVDFKRHNNKELANFMRDLWLGFDPQIIRKWAQSAKLEEISMESWNTEKGIDVFYQVFRKK